MDSISNELVNVLTFLIPGFITAWVVFGLTAAKKPSQFERIVQALIFTAVINAAFEVISGVILKTCLVSLYEYRLAYHIVMALFLGLSYSWLINHDLIHKGLRTIGLTQRSALSNEWNFTHSKLTKNWVVLHMKDGKRLFGFPEICSTGGDDGHYFVIYPHWVNDKGEVELDLSNELEGILIPATEISRVEFCKERLDNVEEQ